MSTKYIVYNDYAPDPFIERFNSLEEAESAYKEHLKDVADEGIPVHIAIIIK